MDGARLRRVAAVAVAGATAVGAFVITANAPGGAPQPTAPAAAAPDAASRALVAREARVAARLARAERHLRSIAGTPIARPPTPVVSAAPSTPPVATSGGS